MTDALLTLAKFEATGEAERRHLNRALDGAVADGLRIRDSVQLGIITALDHEFIAVEFAMVCGVAQVSGRQVPHISTGRAPVTFKVYEFGSDMRAIRVVIAQTMRMGNNSAAVAATAMAYEFPELKDVIMVGIAGGIPSPLDDTNKDDHDLIQRHVRLGDVVVSQEPIIQYDFVNRGIAREVPRSSPSALSPRIVRAIQSVKRQGIQRMHTWEDTLQHITAIGKGEWARPPAKFDRPKRYEKIPNGDVVCVGNIKHPRTQRNRRAGKPLVHYGKIGSANSLLQDPIKRDSIRDELGILAVEMEGSGVSDAAWSFGIGYAVVRGIADYCDPEKSKRWQYYASAAAAAYCRQIINELVVEEVLSMEHR